MQDVSVFVLEKKILDCYDKRDREAIIETFSKGPQQLAKLRHPRLLTVQHIIVESRYVVHVNSVNKLGYLVGRGNPCVYVPRRHCSKQ